MPFMNRPSFLALLDRLDDPDDTVVVAAAREIGSRLREAGVTWNDLLLPAEGAPTDKDGLEGADEIAVPATLDRPADAAAEDLAMIDRLLARPGLSEATRQELGDMRADIAGGEFTARDRRYLCDLEARLAKPERQA
jgi:hypothetical protein